MNLCAYIRYGVEYKIAPTRCQKPIYIDGIHLRECEYDIQGSWCDIMFGPIAKYSNSRPHNAVTRWALSLVSKSRPSNTVVNC